MANSTATKQGIERPPELSGRQHYLCRDGYSRYSYELFETRPIWNDLKKCFKASPTCGRMILSDKDMAWLFPDVELAVGQMLPVDCPIPLQHSLV